MIFLFGLVIGLLIALLVVLAALFFRKPLMVMTADVERKVNSKAMRVFKDSGAVYFPPDDDEIARQDIISENSKKGRDTRISELL